MNFSGRYLIFNLKGNFQGQVQFTGTKEGFRGDQIKLVEVGDSGKFFVFQGHRFPTKEERDAKKAKKKARKEKKKDQPKASGMMAKLKAAKEKQEKEKKNAEKSQSGGKKAPIFYVFKLQCKTNISGQVKWTF